MSVTNPANIITRWSVVDMEGMWVKMFDPPKDSPDTPDLLLPTNPVPEVLAAAGFQRAPGTPHTVVLELMHGIKLDTWDFRLNQMTFFLFNNPDMNLPVTGDEFPSATMRMPRGVVFHCITDGKGPPPHTIHWHGFEPTTINDGVGHCSMEIGRYNYQWQPNYIGSYFAHCHRNTVQHFEFGLYFLILIEPPDAYFATLANPAIPIGHCRDGKRRIAANLATFPQFPDWNSNETYDPDPWVPDAGQPWTADPRIQFATDPHGNTVSYDVEALWVMDDRDSTWSDLAPNARATYPLYGTRPGFNDNFQTHAGDPVLPGDFFAFNDFHADYWYVTGVPVPTSLGGPAASIPANIVIPAGLNSGVAGSQVSINAVVGQTILVRCLDAAYNSIEVTFPVDVVIIAWDGRALGVLPYGHNEAYLVPAGTPIKQTTARRFDGLIRATAPINSYATVKFINTRGQVPGTPDEVLCTARIPINISAVTVTATTSVPSPQLVGTAVTVTATITRDPGNQAPTTGTYEYRFWLNSGAGFEIAQDYDSANTFVWTPAVSGAYDILVDMRSVGSTALRDASTKLFYYQITSVATGVTATPDLASPQAAGTPITITALGQGGSGSYEYRFWLNSGSGFNITQDFSATNTLVWTPALSGAYDILVDVRNAGSTALREASTKIFYYQVLPSAATGVTVTSDKSSPVSLGNTITYTALGQGGSGSYEYRFWINSGSGFTIVQEYSATNTFAWTPVVTGAYDLLVDVRSAGSTAQREASTKIFYYQIVPAAATGVTLTPNLASPQSVGTPVTFTALGQGGSGSYEFRFWINSGLGFDIVQDYSASNALVWTPVATGAYDILVDVRNTGSAAFREASTKLFFYQIQ